MGCGFLVVLAFAGCGGLVALVTGNIRPERTHTNPTTPTTSKPTTSDYDLPEDYDHNHPENPQTIYTPAGSGRVHVKGYYRKDGTYVRPHTRSK
jgi:hypothetical protein